MSATPAVWCSRTDPDTGWAVSVISTSWTDAAEDEGDVDDICGEPTLSPVGLSLFRSLPSPSVGLSWRDKSIFSHQTSQCSFPPKCRLRNSHFWWYRKPQRRNILNTCAVYRNPDTASSFLSCFRHFAWGQEQVLDPVEVTIFPR
jgi:hypothetical protein